MKRNYLTEMDKEMVKLIEDGQKEGGEPLLCMRITHEKTDMGSKLIKKEILRLEANAAKKMWEDIHKAIKNGEI